MFPFVANLVIFFYTPKNSCRKNSPLLLGLVFSNSVCTGSIVVHVSNFIVIYFFDGQFGNCIMKPRVKKMMLLGKNKLQNTASIFDSFGASLTSL